LKINTSTHYAIRVVQYLAGKNKIVSSTELAGAVNVSQRYLMQIIAKLRDGGLLRPTVGMSGGYALLKAPSVISVYDIIMLMEGVGRDAETNRAETDTTMYAAAILLQEYVKAYLQSITFDKFLADGANDWQLSFSKMISTQITELRQHCESRNPLVSRESN